MHDFLWNCKFGMCQIGGFFNVLLYPREGLLPMGLPCMFYSVLTADPVCVPLIVKDKAVRDMNLRPWDFFDIKQISYI